ncbi:MAG TPA: Gfo/Idh/MocA family oxidoreductase [Spirochaetota bacterium]|nr:Gfo/Idh/MocA family oxidoreductase [Spirochaetota bacterium]HPJ35593.1 Gfo/Idh/MocA family oxidoreductase [Spirochaetota bacterium]
MTTNLPGICFVGCGKIAESHAKNLRKLYGDIPLFFQDSDVTKANAFKSQFRGEAAFPELEHALDSEKVNIVFITTPHAYHAEIACAAAKSKKDIILEKPVARSMAEIRKITAAVEKNKVRCTVAENYMFKSFVPKIVKSVNSGHIGKPLFLEINKYNRDNISGWRTDPGLMGGGALLEGGVHWINLLVSIADSEPVSVIAVKPDVEYETPVPFEDSITLLIKFSNGLTAKLFHSWRIPNRLKGVGLSKYYGSEGVITFESNGIFSSVYGRKKKKFFTNFTDFLGYRKMLKSFIDDYVNGKPWTPSLERITMEFRIVDAAYKSLKSGQFEKI